MGFHAIGIKFKYLEKIPAIFQFSKLSLKIPQIPENSWISGEVEALLPPDEDKERLQSVLTAASLYTLKTPGRVKRDPEMVNAVIQFWVKDDPEIGQLASELWSRSGWIWFFFFFFQICRKLTKFSLTFDPELDHIIYPDELFSGSSWPGCFSDRMNGWMDE